MTEVLRFGLVGAAGYVAPRHMRAIKEVGGDLAAAFDPSDSVGVLDSHFPHARFFTEFERFDRYVDRSRRSGQKLSHISICSPNYLHDAHVRFALRSDADAICEKPLVLNPWNLDGLAELEADTGRRVNTILQLRLHPAILELRKHVADAPASEVHEVDLTYITSRGAWYYASWKGDESKSGGIATNIGVHFYDVLGFVFGELRQNVVHHKAIDFASGYLEFERARVSWFLSINGKDLPQTAGGKPTFRSLTIDGRELEFSEGFGDLHTESYRQILAGNGYGVADVRQSIETVSHIRQADPQPDFGVAHPYLKRALADHGRYVDGWPA
jgi:UDP-N-acetyl-2-amino-2-deoxyglucuronate dehydrogenase